MNIHTKIIEKEGLRQGNKFLGNINLDIRWPPQNRHQAAICMAPEKGKRILDVGCGNGTVLYNLRSRFDELHGIELIPEQAEWAKKTLSGCKNLVDIKTWNIEEASPYPDNYFDYVVITDVIEHVFDVKKVVSELVRVTMPGGNACICTPNIAYIKRRLKLLFGRFPMTSNEKGLIEENGLVDGGHIHYLTFHDLFFLLRDYGRVKKMGYGRLFNLVKIRPEIFASGACVCLIKDTD
ncbi:MAG: class I SAM-dependent methyltransferase [Planctomycetota bacterium]|jgi:methionine biosynthesis protein MetW